MSIQYSDNVVRTLARHLGVAANEISLVHDLYRDWGFTPLSLVVVLLDLEQSVALEFPPEGLADVRTVADLVREFRAWVHASDGPSGVRVARRARVSRQTLNERRLRRELHHLRWLEREWSLSNVRAFSSHGRPRQTQERLTRDEGVQRRVASR